MYGMRAEVPGMTQAQYEQAMQQILLPMQARPGFIAHLAGPTSGGWYVVEAWRSKEDFEAWIQEVVQPTLQAAGVAAPQIQDLPVQNVVTP